MVFLVNMETGEMTKLVDNPGKPGRIASSPDGNSKNTNRLDYAVRTLRWFDYYLKDKGPKDQRPEKYIDFEIE